MPGKSRKISRRSRIGKNKKTMKKRMNKTRRNRHKKSRKGMMGGVDTPPSTPREGYTDVIIPPPQTPRGQQSLSKEPTVSPKDKGPTQVNDSEGIQPLALFQE